MTTNETLELEEGLTLRSFLAVIYAVIVLLPLAIYSNLVTAVAVSSEIVLLLFVEIARRTGKPLTPAEAFIIFFVSDVAMTEGATMWLGILLRTYMRRSPIFTALGFSEIIPNWWAPSPASPAVRYRTLLHSEFVMPAIISLIPAFLTMIAEIALSYLLAMIYFEVEKLPFPVAQYQSQMILNLVEREPERFRVFSISTMIGLIYGTLLYAVPNLSMAIFGVPAHIPGLVVPWNDLSRYIEYILPGAAFGISPDLLVMGTAWIIPKEVVIAIFLTSIIIYTFGNSITLQYPSPLFKAWKESWFPGADLGWIIQRSFLTLWVNVMIGMALVAGIMTMLINYKVISRAFSSLYKLPTSVRSAGYISITPLVIIYVICIGGVIALFHTLVPHFPLWPLIVISFIEFIWAFVAGWGVGVCGLAGIHPPYLREFTILAVRYRELDVWCAPWTPVPGQRAAVFVNNAFVAGRLCRCKPSSYFKALIIATLLSWALGILYVNLYWQMAPIPSSVYPWAEYQWPLMAVNWAYFPSIALGKTKLRIFRPELIIPSAVFGISTFLALKLLGISIHAFIGIVAGLGVPPPIAITYMIGLLLSIVIKKFTGKEWWERYKAIIVGGIALGESLIITISGASVLISKSIWTPPY